MADAIVFHHAQGLTSGMRVFGDRLLAAGHRVMMPDLFEGQTFDSLDDGVAYAESVGLDTFLEYGASVASTTDARFVTIGFSLGVLPAQHLAQTHSRALGAVLCHAAIPLGTFAAAWPAGVLLQMHNARGDSWGDFEESQKLAEAVPGAELFEYDTSQHLVADSSLAEYDAAIADHIVRRTLALLASV